MAANPERIRSVALALAEAVEANEQGRRVRLPVIQRADAVGLVEFMHAQLDDVIDERNAQVASRMACRKGCNACCNSPILITEGEAVTVAEWLKQPENAAARGRFEGAYGRWRAAVGDLAAQAETVQPAERRAWLTSIMERKAMCAFNHDGACSIYPVRPNLCRKAHALDTNEHCISQETPVQYFEHPPTEQLYDSQLPMLTALHRAMRPDSTMQLLPFAVHRALGSASAVGRNDPCPCGSGKKYKKCCAA